MQLNYTMLLSTLLTHGKGFWSLTSQEKMRRWAIQNTDDPAVLHDGVLVEVLITVGFFLMLQIEIILKFEEMCSESAKEFSPLFTKVHPFPLWTFLLNFIASESGKGLIFHLIFRSFLYAQYSSCLSRRIYLYPPVVILDPLKWLCL